MELSSRFLVDNLEKAYSMRQGLFVPGFPKTILTIDINGFALILQAIVRYVAVPTYIEGGDYIGYQEEGREEAG